MSSRTLAGLLLAYSVRGAVLLAAQQPQSLGQPLAEYGEPFSRINGLRELADGRLLVSDSRERTLQLIDLASGSAKRISRDGQGPGEYRGIVALVPLPEDQTLLVDAGNRRFLRLGPDGEPVETIGLPRLAPPAGVAGTPVRALSALGLLPPRGVDRWGRLYFQTFYLGFRGESPPDSSAILRWALGSTTVDSVGWVRSGGPGQVFAPAEVWQVALEGRVIRAIPSPYHITLVDSAGRSASGPAVPYTPIRVTEAERERIREERAGRMRQMMSTEVGARAMAGSGGPPSMPPLEFAESKPPFHGTDAVQVAPDGEIWVARTRAEGDRVPVFDVFDQSGRLARRIALGFGSRLVGFGRGVVYVVRTDEDDLEYLQRYRR